MHEHWGAIEADFQREYRINLEESIHTISWRRFLILVKGLSQKSVLVGIMQSQKKQQEHIVEKPEDIEKAIEKVGW
ncbi:Gp15 family bacteriophage protein [Alkalihalobacterium chitinilyticum]|uniref:Gp15 family bacteriophage protein n=1 Tax=Alkalihalobacterium chitinilyticum TaxID=2980103 RepID=UPI00357150BD